MAAPTVNSQLPVVIIGAGISGLSLGQGLLKASIPFRIFERDSSLKERSQGYRVRINSVGIAALSAMLPPSLLARFKDCCALKTGGGMAPTMHLDALTAQRNQQGGMMRGPPPEPVDPLNADRSVLRSVLAHGLETHIDFGREFVGYEHQKSENTINAHFADGSTVSACLLVGADGAGSRVRKQLLPEHVPVDTEGRWIYGKTPLSLELLERFSSEAMSGLTLVQDRGPSREVLPLSLLLEPIRFPENEYRAELPDDYVYWVLISRKENYAPAEDTTLLNLEAGLAGRLAQSMTRHWHRSFQALFDLQDFGRASMLRIASSKPQLPQWTSDGMVTLIGDAIHVMSPTAAVGATTALRDAAALAGAIAEEGVNAGSVSKYEALMRVYAEEAISRSAVGGKWLFGMRPFDELNPISA